MKFTCTVEINKPLAVVLKVWRDESKFSSWQDGFQSKEILSGSKGKEGSKSKIVLSQGNRKMELIETLKVDNLPVEHTVYVEHIHMNNYMTTSFKELTKDKTQYSCTVEYTKFNGFVPNLMARLFPSMFRKQVQKWLVQFKELTEKEV